VEEYIEWAKTLGDAAWQYHQAGGFVVLSALLGGSVKLRTSYGAINPNLWFMILADTTLTRKTTAMDIAMDLLVEIDPDCILATDGSIEGLMQSLSTRPGRPSIFLRDEFSGMMEAMTKKDYYAGMMETLTKLYDGKYQKRVLRKEVIEVKDPVLIFFAGGIRSRIQELLTLDHVMSGFIPRFVLISAESDVTSLRPLGPPSSDSDEFRTNIIDRLKRVQAFYKHDKKVTVDGRVTTIVPNWECLLSGDAWARYNSFEYHMLRTAQDSMMKDALTPTFQRLMQSGLKAAMLIAASRKLEDRVLVEEEDIVRAFYYVEQWRDHTIEIVQNIGQSQTEKSINQVLRAIQRNPQCLRSTIMQSYHVTARDMDAILMTLEQRGQITRVRSGRTERLYPTTMEEP
jgi:hypothetical protein